MISKWFKSLRSEKPSGEVLPPTRTRYFTGLPHALGPEKVLPLLSVQRGLMTPHQAWRLMDAISENDRNSHTGASYQTRRFLHPSHGVLSEIEVNVSSNEQWEAVARDVVLIVVAYMSEGNAKEFIRGLSLPLDHHIHGYQSLIWHTCSFLLEQSRQGPSPWRRGNLIAMLVQEGAPINVQDENGFTPLDAVVQGMGYELENQNPSSYQMLGNYAELINCLVRCQAHPGRGLSSGKLRVAYTEASRYLKKSSTQRDNALAEAVSGFEQWVLDKSTDTVEMGPVAARRL